MREKTKDNMWGLFAICLLLFILYFIFSIGHGDFLSFKDTGHMFAALFKSFILIAALILVYSAVGHFLKDEIYGFITFFFLLGCVGYFVF